MGRHYHEVHVEINEFNTTEKIEGWSSIARERFDMMSSICTQREKELGIFLWCVRQFSGAERYTLCMHQVSLDERIGMIIWAFDTVRLVFVYMVVFLYCPCLSWACRHQLHRLRRSTGDSDICGDSGSEWLREWTCWHIYGAKWYSLLRTRRIMTRGVSSLLNLRTCLLRSAQGIRLIS